MLTVKAVTLIVQGAALHNVLYLLGRRPSKYHRNMLALRAYCLLLLAFYWRGAPIEKSYIMVLRTIICVIY